MSSELEALTSRLSTLARETERLASETAEIANRIGRLSRDAASVMRSAELPMGGLVGALDAAMRCARSAAISLPPAGKAAKTWIDLYGARAGGAASSTGKPTVNGMAEEPTPEADFRNRQGFRFSDRLSTIQGRQLPQESPFQQLSDEEAVAIYGWSTNEFGRINDVLRGRSPQFTEDYRSYIELINSGLSKLPDYDGWVYRGRPACDPDELVQYQPGAVVDELGFTATSADVDKMHEGNVELMIQSKTGKFISPITAKGEEEREVLFRSGTAFEILGREDLSDGKTIIYMLEV